MITINIKLTLEPQYDGFKARAEIMSGDRTALAQQTEGNLHRHRNPQQAAKAIIRSASSNIVMEVLRLVTDEGEIAKQLQEDINNVILGVPSGPPPVFEYRPILAGEGETIAMQKTRGKP